MPNDHRSHNRIAPRRAMDLGVLRCFSRIAALGSMSRAASDLGISQPALTRQIKRLEHDLGNELLVRNSRGVALTEAGHYLLSRIGPLLDQAELIAEELSEWRGALSGNVAVCMPASLHRAVTLPLVADVRRTMPGVRLRVIDGFDALLHDQLRAGLVDLGILVHDEQRIIDGVDQKPLAREQLLLVGQKSAFAQGARLRIRDISDKELALPGERNQLRQHVETLFRRQGAAARIGIEVESMSLANDLVRRGEFFSVVPQSGVDGRAGESVGYWPIIGASISWALCIQKRRAQSPAVREVAKRLNELMLQPPRSRIVRGAGARV
jgi:LysR family nitrogen assimilation transcriptional regulator